MSDSTGTLDRVRALLEADEPRPDHLNTIDRRAS